MTGDIIKMRRERSINVTCAFLILVVASSIFMQVQAISWSANTKQLTSNLIADSFPTLAQTEDLRVWLVWSKEIDSNLTLYYNITSDQGSTWSEAMNLTDNFCGGHDQNPSIMQAQNGTIWVVWTSSRQPPPPPPTPDFIMDALPQNLTIPQGGSDNSTITVTSVHDFSDPVTLSIVPPEPANVSTTLIPTQVTPPINGTANSTLMVTVNSTATPGNYTLTVMGKGDHTIHIVDVYLEIVVTEGTSQTSKTSHVTASSPSSPSLDYDIYYKASHDNGVTWSKDFPLADNNVDDLRPAIIQLANGTIMIVWQSYVSGSHNICYKIIAEGESWADAPTNQLTTDPAHDKGPSVGQMKDGDIWVAWTSMRTGTYDIFYKIYNGLTWSADTTLTNNTNTNVQPAILQTIDENIMIFYTSGAPLGNTDICYKSSSDDGASWSGEIDFAASNDDETWPAVMQTIDTKIWVVWTSNPLGEDWEAFCRTSLAGDVNEDGQINVVDLTLVSLAYGVLEGEPGYNLSADINKDGIVDMRDLRIVAYYLGET